MVDSTTGRQGLKLGVQRFISERFTSSGSDFPLGGARRVMGCVLAVVKGLIPIGRPGKKKKSNLSKKLCIFHINISLKHLPKPLVQADYIYEAIPL